MCTRKRVGRSTPPRHPARLGAVVTGPGAVPDTTETGVVDSDAATFVSLGTDPRVAGPERIATAHTPELPTGAANPHSHIQYASGAYLPLTDTMSGNRDALLDAFVRSDASPDGKWWVDVPVGLSIGDEDDYATVDAVCLTSREQELPEVYPEHTGVSYVYDDADAQLGVTKADTFQSLMERDTFADETVVLVAVEGGKSSVGSVGELLAYRELLEADWDWTVEELLLLSDDDSDHVNYVCGELSIRAVRVA